MQALRCLRYGTTLLGALLALSVPILAQGLKAPSGEVAGVFGWESLKGVDGKTHALFGASGGANASEKVQVFGEYTYLPLGSMSEFGITAKAKAQLVGGGIRVHFGGASSKVNPFVVASGGLARATASASSISVSSSGGYFGAGGGATLFLGLNLGVRPEARFERLQWSEVKISGVTVAEGEGNNIFTIRVSFFFQFGGRK